MCGCGSGGLARGRRKLASSRLYAAQQAKLHVVGRARVLRVVFDAGALQVLHHEATLGLRVGEREAEEGHATVAVVERDELRGERLARLGVMAALGLGGCLS